MLDIIKSYFAKEEYYIIITNNGVYVKNHTRILNVSDKEVLLTINKRRIQITGRNIILKKIVAGDLAITGTIESVKYL